MLARQGATGLVSWEVRLFAALLVSSVLLVSQTDVKPTAVQAQANPQLVLLVSGGSTFLDQPGAIENSAACHCRLGEVLASLQFGAPRTGPLYGACNISHPTSGAPGDCPSQGYAPRVVGSTTL